MVRQREDPIALSATDYVHAIAYVDSQATAFVVPDEGYLTKVTDPNPTMTIWADAA